MRDAGWTPHFSGPADPDDKGHARLWSGVREGEDPTGTHLTLTYQVREEGTHFLLSAHTA